MATNTLSILINQGIRSYYTEICKIRETFQQSAERLPLPVSTIELAGAPFVVCWQGYTWPHVKLQTLTKPVKCKIAPT